MNALECKNGRHPHPRTVEVEVQVVGVSLQDLGNVRDKQRLLGQCRDRSIENFWWNHAFTMSTLLSRGEFLTALRNPVKKPEQNRATGLWRLPDGLPA